MDESLYKLKILHDCNIYEQYAKYPYLNHAHVVTDSFVNNLIGMSSSLLTCSYGNDMGKISQFILSFYFEPDLASKQLAFELWNHRQKLFGGCFSMLGIKAILKTSLMQYIKNKNDAQIMNMCKDLLKYGFIKRVDAKMNDPIKHSTATLPKQPLSSTEHETKAAIAKIWGTSQNFDDFYFQFPPKAQRDFIKMSEFHRNAWTRGTKVQIKTTFDGWQQGIIIQVNKNLLTVAYKKWAKRKVFDRYDVDKIQSSELFIYHRLCLKVGSDLFVYSLSNKDWCKGKIVGIAQCVNKKNVFKVIYWHNNQMKAKYIDRWSNMIRLENEYNEEQRAIYKKGTAVKVWSTSSKKWMNGVIGDTIQNMVNVRYGNYEKLLSVHSPDFRLVS